MSCIILYEYFDRCAKRKNYSANEIGGNLEEGSSVCRKESNVIEVQGKRRRGRPKRGGSCLFSL